MSINTREKGRRNEIRTRNVLEAAGYDVCMAPNPSKWSLENDLFGLWDLMAVSRTEIRFIQVKSNKTAGPEDREAMKLWPCPANCSKEIWVWVDRVAKPDIRIL